jgi:hypothetical protein
LQRRRRRWGKVATVCFAFLFPYSRHGGASSLGSSNGCCLLLAAMYNEVPEKKVELVPAARVCVGTDAEVLDVFCCTLLRCCALRWRVVRERERERRYGKVGESELTACDNDPS